MDWSRESLERVVAEALPGARVLGLRALEGGVSADVQAVRLQRHDGSIEALVVRRHPRSPERVRMEHALLSVLHPMGIPVPKPLALVPTARGPACVMPLVDGTTEWADEPTALHQMARTLADIHAVPATHPHLPKLPRRVDPLTEAQTWLASPQVERVGPRVVGFEPVSEGDSCLLHGDFWPGNLLWRDGCLQAVLDWEDAAVGDPLSDVACARVELACAAGPSAAATFTAAYASHRPVDADRLGLWEVYVSSAALVYMETWGLPPVVEAARRQATLAFLDAALLRLGPGD